MNLRTCSLLSGRLHADDMPHSRELGKDGTGLIGLHLSLNQSHRHNDVDLVGMGADDSGASVLQLGHHRTGLLRVQDEGGTDAPFGGEQTALAGQSQRRLFSSLLVGHEEFFVGGAQFRVVEDGGQFRVPGGQLCQGWSR
jgi:hypothetical protein